jgi:hypothetical protein
VYEIYVREQEKMAIKPDMATVEPKVVFTSGTVKASFSGASPSVATGLIELCGFEDIAAEFRI